MTFPVVSLYSRWISYSQNAVTDFSRIAPTKNFKTVFFHFFQSKISFKVIHHQFVSHMQSFSLIKLLQINYFSYSYHSRSLVSRLFQITYLTTRFCFFDNTTLSFWCSSRSCESIYSSYELLSRDGLIGHDETQLNGLPGPNWSKFQKDKNRITLK